MSEEEVKAVDVGSEAQMEMGYQEIVDDAKKVPNIVGITSADLFVEEADNIVFKPINPEPANLEEFRTSFRTLYACNYVAVDQKTHTTGVYVGYCLAHNIPLITVGTEEIYGAYVEFGETNEWQKFMESLQEQEWTLVAEDTKLSR